MQNTRFFIDYKALRVIFILIFTLSPIISSANELNVYSGRKTTLIKPLLDQFQNETGIKVNLVTAKSDVLIKRIESEGKSTSVDIFITADVGRLDRAKKMDLLHKIDIRSIKNKISPNYIDKDYKWVGLSKRIRTIIYSKKNVNKNDISTFEDLAKDNWKNRICVRSSNNIYNQSLVASLISNHGEKKAEKIVKQIVNNFARKPSGNDRSQIIAVAKNECDIAIVNHYYYAMMLNSKDEEKRKFSDQVDILFLNQKDRGAHVNISGIGIIKYSKNIYNAHKLISFLLNNQSQEWYAEINNEYPVIENVNVTNLLNSWGKIKLDDLTLNKLGDLNPNAVKLMDRVGWK
jgi:iron(III) transport system substrate-binding protein